MADGGFFQTGNQAQSGGFACPGGAKQDKELAIGNVQIQILDRCMAAEYLGDVFKFDPRHVIPA